MPKARLYLKDGSEFVGDVFGALSDAVGELVFTTAMNGYVESFTDPSYKGQILVMTHPMIGNYGVPKPSYVKGILRNFESEHPTIEGLVVSSLTEDYKWNSAESLDAWLERHGVIGIQGVDTRELTLRIREHGSMNAVISAKKLGKRTLDKLFSWEYESEDMVLKASTNRIIDYGGRGKRLVVFDYGLKHGILENLYSRGFHLIRVPAGTKAEAALSYKPNGIVLTNGPGNPALLRDNVKEVAALLEYGVPTLGICLGHQLVSMALGMKVQKMKFGHRAINKPVIDLKLKKAYITTHNHGYAVYKDNSERGVKVRFMSPDDGIIEGLEGTNGKLLTTQFHPEARPGTNDALFIFDEFARMV
jgi:carbamoyl-phosphate synthase small subunit